MDSTWEKDGLLFGSLSEEDCAKGGKWTIGDLLPQEHPGHSQLIKYKTWVARPDKYKPGSYAFKDRLDSGLWEYVMVMKNTLIALESTQDNSHISKYELNPGKVAEFPPKALRSWELPNGAKEARGCTLLYYRTAVKIEGLRGYGDFCFEQWDVSTAADQLYGPFPEGSFGVQYVEVFNGSLLCITGKGTVTLNSGDHVYVGTGVSVRFQIKEEKTKTYGTVLYF